MVCIDYRNLSSLTITVLHIEKVHNKVQNSPGPLCYSAQLRVNPPECIVQQLVTENTVMTHNL